MDEGRARGTVQPHPMDATELRELLAFAVDIAEAAGPIALRYFRTPLDVHDKGAGAGFDPVTRADHEIETFVRAEITARFPEHGVIGEEQGQTHGAGALCWIIDPIDGTRSFISGSPAWGTLLGLLDGDTPIVGVAHIPYLHETFFGAGDGAWLKHDGALRRIHTRDTARVADAILYCTHPAFIIDASARAGFERVAAATRMLRYGGDCYSFCLLALGQVDLVIDGSLQPYDIIPLMPIIEAAGGVVTDAGGGSARVGGVIVAAANAALHAQALALMKQ
jgi:histidinol phosphatase-like enzyme (inositol monophosphatase family)